MALADRLIEKAQEYEQRAAHFVELAEHSGDKADAIVANGWTIVAVALREVVQAMLEEEAEELAA